MFLIHLLISSVFAVTVVIDLPDTTTLVQEHVEITEPTNVGAFSMRFFENKNIPYDGSELGFLSIAGVEQKLDVLSKTEMRAYGWCFSLDGKIPETLAHQTELKNDSTLRWFYAFAHYQSGVWLSQCEE